MDVDVAEAEWRLDDLLARVELGEDIVLTRDGAPVARLEPVPAVSGEAVAHAASVLGTHWRGHMLGCHFWADEPA